MDTQKEPVTIIGAGPAGLMSAISLARGGRAVVVHEQRDDCGARFHGDFQGFQNWVWERDTLDVLHSRGLEIDFLCYPICRVRAYVNRSRPFELRSRRPFFYLVKRGRERDCLDEGLKRQALRLGVEFRWNHRVTQSDGAPTIYATGPKGANILARGVVFETDHEDDCVIVIDNEMAPKGYAYLLIHKGRATLATCFFGPLRGANALLLKTVDRFREIAGIDTRWGRTFGGFGRFYVPLRFNGEPGVLYAGEAAGLMDYLWGFGLHTALISGSLAAESILYNRSYPESCARELTPIVKASLVNRWLYGAFGEWIFPSALERMEEDEDYAFSFLRRLYGSSWIKDALFPILAAFSPSASFAPPEATGEKKVGLSALPHAKRGA